MIGQMAFSIALIGFRDLGSSVTPTFLFRKNEQKINVGSLKNLKISVHGTWNPAILWLQGA